MADEKLENQNIEQTAPGAAEAPVPPVPPQTEEKPQKAKEELKKPYVPQPGEPMPQPGVPQPEPQQPREDYVPLVDFVAPNLDLMMNVPMQLSVEIGRAKKTLREILELNKDSLVVLDKAAGETVDLYVNGSIIAKGEVVVVDEHFGIRITEILTNKEMLDTL